MESIAEKELKPSQPGNQILDLSRPSGFSVQNRIQLQMENTGDPITEDLKGIVNVLRPGEFHPFPIQTPDAFWILQYMGNKENEKLLRILMMPKISYSSWVEDEIRKVPIQNHNQSIWDSMLHVIPVAREQFQNVSFESD